MYSARERCRRSAHSSLAFNRVSGSLSKMAPMAHEPPISDIDIYEGYPFIVPFARPISILSLLFFITYLP
jgi:hypothetical protein